MSSIQIGALVLGVVLLWLLVLGWQRTAVIPQSQPESLSELAARLNCKVIMNAQIPVRSRIELYSAIVTSRGEGVWEMKLFAHSYLGVFVHGALHVVEEIHG